MFYFIVRNKTTAQELQKKPFRTFEEAKAFYDDMLPKLTDNSFELDVCNPQGHSVLGD